jgi:hypothetical protein
MNIALQSEQATILREILQSSLHELRIESARTDTHDFRERLHARERLVESILDKLSEDDRVRATD